MLMVHLGTWLKRLSPRLPASLAPALEACLGVAAMFRGDVMAVLEQPLGDAPLGLDFSVRLEQAQQCLQPKLLPASVAELFARRAAGAFKSTSLPSIWLEYDLRQDLERAPISCFRLGREADPGFVRELLPVVGSGLEESALSVLAGAIASLPEGTRLLYLFDLSARGRPAVRCEIAGEPLSLVPWLESLGAKDQAALLPELASWAGTGKRHHVSVDFDGAWAPRVGLENSFRGRPRELEPWQKWLDALATSGLIRREQIGPLLAWPTVETPGQSAGWPLGPNGSVPGWSVACLSHLKLARVPDGVVEVKAYRLFQYLAREVREWPLRG